MPTFIPTYHNPGVLVNVTKWNWRDVANLKTPWIWESWIPKEGE